MAFWDKVGGAAKWITDPKQLLTAAGFMVGGPVGAGVGRAIGGMVPQSAGPVPWGALGADTSDFRESTLADGLDWGDVGTAGKDFVSGYSAGKIGQQVPGIKNLEGDSLIRAFGGGQQGMQGMGANALMQNNPDFMQTPNFGPGVGSGVAPPVAGGLGVDASGFMQTPNFGPGMSPAGALPGAGGGGGFSGQYPNYARFAGAGSAGGGVAPPAVRGVGVGMDALTQRSPNFSARPVPDFRSFADENARTPTEGGGFFGNLSMMEKLYLGSQAASALPEVYGAIRSGSGGDKIGPAPSGWGAQPRYAIPSYSDWRSRGA